MSTTTKIEWTDRSWTPVVGCDPISPACANCYAALMAARLEAMGQEKYVRVATRNGNVGKWTGKVTLWEPDLLAPLKVRKPSTWFLTSMGDVAHQAVPDGFLDRLFAVMALCPQHTFYLLTKRPGRLDRYFSGEDCRGPAWSRKVAVDATASILGEPFAVKQWPLPNALIGCTAEDQTRADERRQHMASIAAAGWHTFVSYEPALGPVDWSGWEFLSWLISGGESGHRARPSHPAWHRTARDWCAANEVPYLFKQWGEWLPGTQYTAELAQKDQEPDSRYSHAEWDEDGDWTDNGKPGWAYGFDMMNGGIDDDPVYRVGKKAAGRQLDGVEHNEKPRRCCQ